MAGCALIPPIPPKYDSVLSLDKLKFINRYLNDF
jgi:hypothetical protein